MDYRTYCRIKPADNPRYEKPIIPKHRITDAPKILSDPEPLRTSFPTFRKSEMGRANEDTRTR